MDEKIEIPHMDSGHPADVEMKMKNYRAYRLVFFLLGFVEVLLGLRFFFKLLGANPENIFAKVIYGLSGILLLPFTGLFRGTPVAPGSRAQILEPSTVIAMIIFALMAWGISKLILIFKSKPAQK